jgi:CHASE2 domain-containing sensor protein
VIAALYLADPQPLKIAELNPYDQHFQLRGPRPGNDKVVIVAIDEASLREKERAAPSRALETVRVARGKTRPVVVYELLGLTTV